jgi:glycosyltransferase involved in cell wall biosynthesis
VKVSVVIPTYNRAAMLGEAVGSALAQTFRDHEVIVVDDGSTDDTASRVAQWRDPRVRYVRQPNSGPAGARNAGVALARGELIAFLDSDDLWKPDKLEREVEFLARYPEAGAVFSDLEKHDGTEFTPSFMRATAEFSKRLAARVVVPDGVVLPCREIYLYLLREAMVLPSAFAMRRAVFTAAGGFTCGLEPFEDWEFFLRLARTVPFGYLDRPLAVLRISADSIHRLHAVKGRLAMLRILGRERREHEGDAETDAAIRYGIGRLHTRLGWYFDDGGRPADALRHYVRGFWEVRDPMLLARAIGLVLPVTLRQRMKSLLRSTRSDAPPTEASVIGSP